MDGSTFRLCRINKNITQEMACGGKFHRTNLSKFESGRVQISNEKINILLSNINLSIEEFNFIKNNYRISKREILLKSFFNISNNSKVSDYDMFEKEASEYLKENNDHTIFDCLNLCRIMRDLHNSSSINTHLLITSANKIWTRISSQNIWFIDDIRLINQLLFIFPSTSFPTITKELLSRLKTYEQFNGVKPLEASIYLNVSYLCLVNNNFSLASELAQHAIDIAIEIRRYDLLSVGYIRRGISTCDFCSIQKGIRIIEAIDEKELLKALEKEIREFDTT